MGETVKASSDDDRILGCLLGAAIADAIALPFEGMSSKRITAFKAVPLRHRLLFNRGFCSDDTEHALMLAKAMLRSRGDIDLFQTLFARRLVWWLLACPAGIGLATLRACLKLLIGLGPKGSGVMSASNGPAMRAAIIGQLQDSMEGVVQFARASATITHRDPRAIDGAIVIAMASWILRNDPATSLEDLLDAAEPWISPDSELALILQRTAESLAEGESTQDYCSREFGESVSGFVLQTVPAALHAWQSHRDDYMAAVETVVLLGGDTDTVAAITGSLVGITNGTAGIPLEWRQSYADWPLSIRHIERTARAAAKRNQTTLPRLNPIALLLRNVLFASVVLGHGFRRLAPPY